MYEGETVTLNRGDYTTCTIHVNGATITSWRCEDEEQVFVSRLTRFCDLLQLRGGIAFAFPHFGGWSFGPRHGFAKNLIWKLEEGPTVQEDLDVYAVFTLENDALTESMWNYKFKLMYKITLSEKSLNFDIMLENKSPHFPFYFILMHHSLFKPVFLNMLYEGETVTLNRGDYTTCTIHVHGVTVTSWKFEDEEQLFVSRLARFCGLLQVRGGITPVFPHFGPWCFGPRHGFAKNLTWKLVEGPAVQENLDVYALFTMENDAYTESMWNYNFKLMYKITLSEKSLNFDIMLENNSPHFPFYFILMHHSLFKVPDVTKTEVFGLKGIKYIDQLDSLTANNFEHREAVRITEWTDRIYQDIDESIVITHTMKDRALAIIKNRVKDTNVWNPWKMFSKNLKDLDKDEYKNFLAVEPGHVSTPYRLGPMSCWRAKGNIKVIEPEIVRKGHFYDLFDKYC